MQAAKCISKYHRRSYFITTMHKSCVFNPLSCRAFLLVRLLMHPVSCRYDSFLNGYCRDEAACKIFYYYLFYYSAVLFSMEKEILHFRVDTATPLNQFLIRPRRRRRLLLKAADQPVNERERVTEESAGIETEQVVS